MHFNPVPDERSLDVGNLEITCFRIAFLAFSVIARVEELWGMSVEGASFKAARTAAARTDIVGAFEARAEVGDFVIVTAAADQAFVAEVLEVCRSTYGNESYRVKYLADRPHPDVEVDTVMPDLVHGYVRGREAAAGLEENLRAACRKPDGAVDEEAVRELLAAAGPDAMREGVAKSWTPGMSKYVHRQMAKNRDKES